MMTVQTTFSIPDYVVFGGMLLISAGIGVYHAIAGGGQQSTRQFLMADKSMSFLPVAFSVLASFFSASTLLGTPAEIYQYGTMYWISVFGAMMTPVAGALLFGPMFFRLKIVSVFEYLEMRFKSKAVRLLGAFVFLLRTILGMGIVLFGPSTALSAVTDFPVWAIIILIGAVCTFYTSLGGLKAVIWTDVFQTLVMLAGMLAVLIQASINVGGMDKVWQICSDSGRIAFFDFNTDPHQRHTFWALTIGIFFVWLPPYTVDQQMVQRFSSTKSLRDAKLALLCNVPGMFILITLTCVVGLTLFAYYAECDPLKTGRADNPNQLLPVFVLEILGQYKGLSGLFVASLFSGALSSISSMLNSLAAVTWEDFCKLGFPNVSDRRATMVTKFLAVMYGCIGVGVAFLVERLGGTVLQMSLTFNGATGSALVGIFILGACFTSPNWIGAFAAGTIGLAFPLWLSIGRYVTKPLDFHLPTSTCGCSNTTCGVNLTCSSNTSCYVNFTAPTLDTSNLTGLEKLYSLSYLWFSVLGILTTVFLGLVISLATGPTKSCDVDEKLQLQLFDKMCGSFSSRFGRNQSSKKLWQHDEKIDSDVELTRMKEKSENGLVLVEGDLKVQEVSNTTS